MIASDKLHVIISIDVKNTIFRICTYEPSESIKRMLHIYTPKNTYVLYTPVQ